MDKKGFMKKTIISIVFSLLFSCQNKTNDNTETNHLTDIELVKKHLKLQEKIDLSEDDADINNIYHLTEFDMELGGRFVYQGLVQNGYKVPEKEVFDQRIKEIFDSGNCLYSAKRNHNDFVTYFVYDKNLIKNFDEIEYDYTFDHIYVYPKLEIITPLPLLGDILTINKDKINIHLSEQIIHRNKYLFNDDRASFVWLRSNDTWFLESLVKTFGYVEDKVLLDFVLKENYKDLTELEKILISRSCGGKNRLNTEVFAVVKGWKKKELSDFSFRIQELMYTLIKKEEQGKSEIDFPELTKILSETAYHMSKTDEDSYYNFFPILNLTEKYREEIEKKNFYNNPDLKRVWDETKTGGRWRPGMEEVSLKRETLETITLYPRPDFSSTPKQLEISTEDIEYLHKVSDWDFVRVPHMVGYLAPKNPKKHSFLVEEDFTPKKEKGFWDKLFG